MNVLMVHGVDTGETPEVFKYWKKAAQDGLPNTVNNIDYLKYNHIFDELFKELITKDVLKEFVKDIPDISSKYGPTAIKLIESAVWYKDWMKIQLNEISPDQPSPDENFLKMIRWTAVMTAQWIIEPGIRKKCKDALHQKIVDFKPDIICAHSLGSLICYDYLKYDNRHTIFNSGILLTLGSQIGNPVVIEGVWKSNSGIQTLDVKQWCNLYNPNDPVFVVPIQVTATNFNPVITKFGRKYWDISAHNAAWTDKDKHNGYLDNPKTIEKFWKGQT